jgi:hypothetical protein
MKLPKWRKFTWVILIINVLFLVWVVSGIAGGTEGGSDCLAEAKRNPLLNAKDCDTAAEVGTAIGVGIVIFFWVAVDLILGVIWLITDRRLTRDCPVCGNDVKKGVTVCPSCGHDLARAQQPTSAPPSPA